MHYKSNNSKDIVETTLDPANWNLFREQAHILLDACISKLENARDYPWTPVDKNYTEKISLADVDTARSVEDVVSDLINDVLPNATGNTHPCFFGWVHGTGLTSGLLAEIVSATMNSNCGGRDHGAIYVEREVIDWCKRTFGFPESSSGVLVTGTSQATLIALCVARTKALGLKSRYEGIYNHPKLTCYASAGTHSAVKKALEVLGHGSESLRLIRNRNDSGIDCLHLESQIIKDINDGYQPFCVIGTAGYVDHGGFDSIDGLVSICNNYNIWLHIDGAFGIWAKLAGKPWSDFLYGLENVDSIAFDFHKWMYLQYDCGAVLIKDGDAHKSTFAIRPDYLKPNSVGLGGGDPWFCDYGVDLSRGFKALKIWTALREHGSKKLGLQIRKNCNLALMMADLLDSSDNLRLVCPIKLNICCFTVLKNNLSDDNIDWINEQVAQTLQIKYGIVLSTTKINGRVVLRAAITNHRTTTDDIVNTVNSASIIADLLIRNMSKT